MKIPKLPLVSLLLIAALLSSALAAPGDASTAAPPAGVTGLPPIANWTASGGQAQAWFGYSVASAGDVNGDGYDDVVVGAHLYDGDLANEGKAFLYLGSAAGLSPTFSWTAEGDQENAWFGWSVGGAGDVNGDGYDDVIVGSYMYDNGSTNEGGAFLYYGSAAGLNAAHGWSAEGDQPYAQFGYSVGSAGDVNGDGYDDVIVGARLYDDGQGDEGRAFVYYGSASGLGGIGWWAESDQDGAELGCAVGTAGDVNGDGYDDVAIGAYRYDDGQNEEGWALVYHGSDSGLGSNELALECRLAGGGKSSERLVRLVGQHRRRRQRRRLRRPDCGSVHLPERRGGGGPCPCLPRLALRPEHDPRLECRGQRGHLLVRLLGGNGRRREQ